MQRTLYTLDQLSKVEIPRKLQNKAIRTNHISRCGGGIVRAGIRNRVPRSAIAISDSEEQLPAISQDTGQ